MTDAERAFARAMLAQCLAHLGVTDPDAARAAWAAQRLELVAALRRACDDYGDNDWADDLSLVDVLEKHLLRHLPDPDGDDS